MINSLFGIREDTSDLAKKIAIKMLSSPFYEIIPQSTLKGCSVPIDHKDTFLKYLGIGEIYCAGVYSIFNENRDVCLYTGYSSVQIQRRIYRFFKELGGTSRHDEKHPGAKKAYEDGVRISDKFYLKFLSESQFPLEKDGYYIFEHLDEYLAHILKSKYNTNVMVVE